LRRGKSVPLDKYLKDDDNPMPQHTDPPRPDDDPPGIERHEYSTLMAFGGGDDRHD
jgi:hypothetical protein